MIRPTLASRPAQKVLLNHNQARTHLYSRYKHGPLARHNPKPDYIRWVKDFFGPHGVEFVKKEAQRAIKNTIRPDEVDKKFGEESIIDHFDSEESIKRWKPVADSDTLNGFSTANFIRSQSGHGLFTGIIDNRVPDDGLSQKSGFAGLVGPIRGRHKLFQLESFWDWSRFTSVVLRYRGDGRRYNLVVNTSSYRDDQSYYDIYIYPVYTKGGPYWQNLRIPFSKLIFCNRVFVQDYQRPFPTYNVKFVGLNINDSYDGPFSLELDYIGLRKDMPSVEQESPYEFYAHPHIKFRQLSFGCDPPEEE